MHLEVHEHAFITGPRARGLKPRFFHSHEGGDEPHAHPDTGPACYTIDKDDWLRATGMRGGARKKFSVKPTGEQMPVVALEDWQKSFEIIVCKPTAPEMGAGPGMALPTRMVLAHKMTIAVVRSDDSAA